MSGQINGDSIEIESAFPVKEIAHENGRINVEMDVESALDVRTEIEERGMTIVGWYHSHPTFEPDPSRLDIDNQMNYQNISEKLFLGCIFTPYLSATKMEGVLNLFNVEKNDEQFSIHGYHPALSVRYSLMQGSITPDSINRALKLVENYKNLERSILPSKIWKKGITYAEKIKKLLEKIELSNEQIDEIHKSIVDNNL